MRSIARAKRGYAGWLLILPLVLILVPFFIVPIVGVVAASFVQSDGFGGIIPSFTFDNYKSVFTSQLTLQLYWATLKFAAFAWFFSLLIGFWIAYFLVFHVRNQLLASASGSPTSWSSTSATSCWRWDCSCCARCRSGPRISSE